jgi:hypothetical protein
VRRCPGHVAGSAARPTRIERSLKLLSTAVRQGGMPSAFCASKNEGQLGIYGHMCSSTGENVSPGRALAPEMPAVR